ncbi:hypothetical protein SY85_14960 [Flavisolibacter tropicus]|uniref:Uncharacterized protein n=2 Tax=Flavisolibacter tropicus TaxID=1492898 RepID=A0A172TX75_9BACT|nr:hypothetical protein SY85_14960 [Flavisolibacter tropicus]
MKGHTVVKDSLIETVVLKKNEVDLLTDILFNNFYKTKTKVRVITQCYEPRNAILFIDKKGILRDYILICFHCDRYDLGSNQLKDIGDECYGKTEKLRTFFKEKGLLFGTDMSVNSYPGETNKDPGIPSALENN